MQTPVYTNVLPDYVEICHIKPISKFDLDATIGEVNAKDNIAILCPNCHTELDKGLFDASELDSRRWDLHPELSV